MLLCDNRGERKRINGPIQLRLAGVKKLIIKRVGIPIYLQVKNNIVEKIKTGQYAPGDKLPTERELSQQLGISRNTVSAAYKELMMEGVLEARQGRGTFVAAGDEESDLTGNFGSRRDRLMKLIDDTLQKAVEMGFSVEQVATIVSIRAKEMAELAKSLRVAVVNETPEYIDHYISQIRQIGNVICEKVTAEDIVQEVVSANFLTACDLIVVTAECFPVVASKLGNNPNIITVTVAPSLEAVIRIARQPVGSRLGVIAQSRSFASGIERLLEKNAIRGLTVEWLDDEEGEAVRRFVADHNVLIVSEERQTAVRRWTTVGQEVIPFFFEIDQGSLNQVRGKLVGKT